MSIYFHFICYSFGLQLKNVEIGFFLYLIKHMLLKFLKLMIVIQTS